MQLAAFRPGVPETGVSHYLQALAVARRCGHLSVECTALANLAWVALDGGDWVECRRYLDASGEMLVVLDHPWQRATNLLTRAWLHREEGDLDRAEQHIASAHEVLVAGGYTGNLPAYHLEVVWPALARGQSAQRTRRSPSPNRASASSDAVPATMRPAEPPASTRDAQAATSGVSPVPKILA